MNISQISTSAAKAGTDARTYAGTTGARSTASVQMDIAWGRIIKLAEVCFVHLNTFFYTSFKFLLRRVIRLKV